MSGKHWVFFCFETDTAVSTPEKPNVINSSNNSRNCDQENLVLWRSLRKRNKAHYSEYLQLSCSVVISMTKMLCAASLLNPGLHHQLIMTYSSAHRLTERFPGTLCLTFNISLNRFLHVVSQGVHSSSGKESSLQLSFQKCSTFPFRC